MSASTGMLLVATPALLDPNFVRTVVFLIQHEAEGTVGVVLNRPTTEQVADHLPALAGRTVDPPAVFSGGPVEPAVAIGLERGESVARPIEGVAGVGMVDLVEEEAPGRCRVFSGYAGWGPGQLEEEIDEGSWIVVPATADDVFSPDPDQLWSAVLRRQGGRLALLASHPLDPTLN